MSFENILLGLLHTPATGYELKNRFDTGVRHFWNAELAQIYPTLKRLEGKGLLTVEEGPSKRGPAQKIYSRTDEGDDQLESWLMDGAHTTPLKSALLAQLWFLGDSEDSATTKKVLEAALAEWRHWHAALNSLHKSIEIKPTQSVHPRFNQYLTLTFGLSNLAANIAWATQALTAWENDSDDDTL